MALTISADLRGIRARMRQLEAFAKHPDNYDRLCAYCAVRVHRAFGGEVWGYWCNENPAAVVGKSVGGHDFAIVDGRFLVDAWASLVEGLPIPIVMDLQTKAGRMMVDAWYGDQGKWVNTRKADWHYGPTPLGLNPARPSPEREGASR